MELRRILGTGLAGRQRPGCCDLSQNDLYAELRVSTLKAFVDDSGSGGDSVWVVLAGYTGTAEGGDRFNAMWLSALHDSPSIAYFKSKEAERLKDQFAGFTKDQRDAKLDALIGVIGNCAERAVCVRARQRDYDDIFKGKIPERYDSPYYFLFPLLIGAAVNIERIDGFSEATEFVFDTDQRFDRLQYEMVPKLLPLQSFSGGIVNVTYCDDKEILPLQAADLLAWQIRRAFSVTTEPRRRHFDAALNCPRREPHSFIASRATMIEMMRDLSDTLAQESARLGRPITLREL